MSGDIDWNGYCRICGFTSTPCKHRRHLLTPSLIEQENVRLKNEVVAHRDNQVAMQTTINAQEAEIFDLKIQLRRANERMEALRRMFLGA